MVECASFHLYHRLTAVVACGGFAAECCVGRRHQSTVAGAQQQRRRSMAFSSKCGQCHVDSQGTRLNTDLLDLYASLQQVTRLKLIVTVNLSQLQLSLQNH